MAKKRTCYTKIGDRWINPTRLSRLESAVELYDKEKNPKLKADLLANIEAELNMGVLDMYDDNGNLQIADIFDDFGLPDGESRTAKDKILDNLTIKANSLEIANETTNLTSADVWNLHSKEFVKAGISFDEVADALVNFNSPIADKASVPYKMNSTPLTKRGEKLKQIRNLIKRKLPTDNSIYKWLADSASKYGNTRELTDIREKFLLRQNRVNATTSKVLSNITKLQNFMDNGKGKKLTDAQRKNILLKVQGKQDLDPTGLGTDIDNTLEQLLQEIRRDLDLLSSQLQTFSGRPYDTIDVIENKKGEYLTITYEIFSNPNWLDKLFNKENGMTDLGKQLINNAMPVYESYIKAEHAENAAKLKIAENVLKGLPVDTKNYEATETTIDNLKQRQGSLEAALGGKSGITGSPSKPYKASLANFIMYDLKSKSGREFNPLGQSSSSKTRDTIFKRRNEDIPEPIKALWGDLTTSSDPITALVNGVAKMALQLENSRFQLDIANVMRNNKDKYYTTDPNVAAEKGWVEINTNKTGFDNLMNSLTAESVDKIYIPPELESALTSQLSLVNSLLNDKNEGLEKAIKILNIFTGVLKKNMTVWSLSSQSVNLFGNISFALSSGKASSKDYLSNLNEAGKIYWAYVAGDYTGADLTLEQREFFNLAESYGISNSSIDRRIIKEQLDSKQVNAVRDWFKNNDKTGVSKTLSVIDKVASNAYEAGDGLWKLADFKTRLDEYTNILTDKTNFKDVTDPKIKKQISDMAALETRNEFPNYNELPSFVKGLAKTPLIGPFPSFAAATIQTRFSTLKRQVNHINGTNLPKDITESQRKAIRNKAAKELGANLLGSYVAGLLLPSLISQVIGGLSPEEEKTIRDHTLLPWETNGFIIRSKDTGRYTVVQSSYYMPSAYLTEIVEPVLRSLTNRSDKPLTESMVKSLSLLLEPYYTEDLGISLLMDARKNTNQFGSEIATTNDLLTSVKQISDYVVKAVGGIPAQYARAAGYNKQAEDARKAMDKSNVGTDKYKRAEKAFDLANSNYDSKKVIGLYSMGWRENHHDLNQDITWSFVEAATGLAKAKGIFTARAGKFETNKEILEGIKDYTEKQYHEELDKARELYEVYSTTLPDADLTGVFAGEYKFNTSLKDGIKKLFSAEERAYIRGYTDSKPSYNSKKYTDRIR